MPLAQTLNAPKDTMPPISKNVRLASLNFQTLPEPTFVALDFETADNGPDSACALGLAKVQQNAIVDTRYFLIRPPRPRVLFTWVHGITWQDVKDCPTFAQVWPEISAFLQDTHYLVAHNAAFDRRVLEACCQAAHLPPPAQPFICTLQESRRSIPLPSHKLNVICDHLNIHFTHHHAAHDAAAAAKILIYLLGL